MVDYIIFTDASSRTDASGGRYTASAAVVLNTASGRYVERTAYLGSKSSQFGEANGIAMGLEMVLPFLDDGKHHVLVVTDSKLCVNAINEWIPNVWRTDGSVWTKRDGTLVKNQDQYKRIIGSFQKRPNTRFQVVHINSHTNPLKDWKRAIGKLGRVGIRLDKKTSATFILMNDRVDRLAQNTTNNARQDLLDGFGRLVRKG